MLEVDGLNVKYNGAQGPVISALKLHIKKGKMNFILGPTGSGKSTILHSVLGLLDRETAIVTGSISEGGRVIKMPILRNKPSGIAFQKPIFFSWMSLQDNVRSLISASEDESVWDQRFAMLDELLDQFGLWNQRDIQPHQASGGMLARLNIVRAICTNDEYLFIDEALSGVDEVLRDKIGNIITSVTTKNDLYTVIVTHSIYDAAEYGDNCLILLGNPISDALLIDQDRKCTDLESRMHSIKRICQENWYGG